MEINFRDDSETCQVLTSIPRGTLDTLLKKLFSDRATHLVIRALTPGISGSQVLLVQPTGTGAQQPCVVKVGPGTDIEREYDSWNNFVSPYHENRYLPGVYGVAAAEEHGAIAYQFYATRTLGGLFEELSAADDRVQLVEVLGSLLRITNNWSGERRSTYADLLADIYPVADQQFDEFERRSAVLERKNATRDWDWERPRAFWRNPGHLKDRQLYSIRHGDLHFRNVLVSDDYQLCLIDFLHSGWNHFIRDHATLEADLVLNVLYPESQTRALPSVYQRVSACYRRDNFLATAISSGIEFPDTGMVRLLVSVLQVIREDAWHRMELDEDEIPGYFIGVMRRMLSMTIRADSGLSDSQRWFGSRLVSDIAEHLSSDASATPHPASPPRVSHSAVARRQVTSVSLARKLQALAKQRTPRIVLIGGVYLDLILYPIDTVQLDHREWANLEGIKMQLGGSAYYMGKYLYEQYQQESELVTIVGSTGDPLSAEAARLLEGEGWVRNDVIIDRTGSGTAVSVHLVQRSEEFTTIFTHRGALDHLSWEDISRASSAVSQGEPAVLYISAYFRSNLQFGLVERLRTHSKRHVIVLDHGRVNPETDHPQAAVAVKEAFKRGYVDIYVCTFGQLWALDKSPAIAEPIPVEMRTHEFFLDLTARLSLPPVTVIRGADWPGEGTAYLLLDGELHVVSDVGERTGVPIGGVGPKNAFNASFLMSLIETGLRPDTVVDAVRAGLSAWISNC